LPFLSFQLTAPYRLPGIFVVDAVLNPGDAGYTPRALVVFDPPIHVHSLGAVVWAIAD
jgi:hypothetical protein